MQKIHLTIKATPKTSSPDYKHLTHKTMTLTSKKWWQDLKCTCNTNKPKNCILHSCPCGCDMSIADENYQDKHMTNIFYEQKN